MYEISTSKLLEMFDRELFLFLPLVVFVIAEKVVQTFKRSKVSPILEVISDTVIATTESGMHFSSCIVSTNMHHF